MTATTRRSHPVHALLGETVAVTLMPERADPSAATLLFDADEAPADGAAPAEPQATAAARYEFVGTLGAGGMGEVLAARDKRLRRLVAFKKLLPEAAANPRVLARFLCEAQITSQLDHPNVVPIYGLEVNEGGSLAYAMKMIDGVELADLLRDAAAAERAGQALPPGLDLAARLEIFVKVCDAMAFAHEKGVLHRDLKPANIMVGRHGAVYVVDWGIARLLGERGAGQDRNDAATAEPEADQQAADTSRTRIGQALGTPLYMSPEQAMGRNDQLDARSDVFTLGLILQEVVTLQRARDGETVVEVLLGAIEATRRPIEHVAGRPVARELRAIIEKAAAVDPAERYATVDALAEDVRRHIRGDAVSAAPDSLPRRVARWIAKNRMKAMVVLFMTVIVIPLGGVITGLLLHDAKVEALHQREESLTALTSEVAVRAAELDAELYWYEGVASDVAGAMSVLAAELGEPAARARLERHLAALIGSEGIRGRSSRHIARIRARDVSGQLALASASPSAPPAEALTLAIPEAAGWAASGAGTRFVARYTTPVRVPGVGVIGAVEVEVGTDSLHDDLDVPAAGSVLETLLVRPGGEIAGHVVHGAAPLDLQPVLAELAPKLAAPSDWIEVETGGKDLLVAWHRVQALGWSFVVVVDRARL